MSSQNHSKVTDADLGYHGSDHEEDNFVEDDASVEDASLASGPNQGGTSCDTKGDKKYSTEDEESMSNNSGAFGSSEPGTSTISEDKDCKKEISNPTYDAASPPRHSELLPKSAESDGTSYIANEDRENTESHVTDQMNETEPKHTDQNTKKMRFESLDPSSSRKLLREIESIQETTSPQDNEAEVEQSSNHVADSPAIEHSLLRDTGDQAVVAEISTPLDKKQIAEQSCREMGYRDEQVEQAVQEFQHQHDPAVDYSGCDLAGLMMQREDEVQQILPDEPTPGNQYSLSHGKDGFSRPSGIEYASQDLTDDPGSGQYITTATVRDKGHHKDGCSHRNISIDVALKKGECCNFDEPNITWNYYFM